MRLARLSIACCLGLVAPATAWAQNGSQPHPPAPSPSTPPAPATPAESKEFSRSLFDVLPNQFQFGGRLSSEEGDPARFQRYQDLGDGALFTTARYTRDDPGGRWLFHAAADNVGWRDQRYYANYERTGRFAITGAWDEVPQFYSVATRTPYTTTKSPLLLDDATQRQIQAGQATSSAYIPISPQFDLRERRDIGAASFVATPTPQIDVKAAFTS